MNIRKIIREELDSFEWVNDIPDHGIYDGVEFTNGEYRESKTLYTIRMSNLSDTTANIFWGVGDEDGGGIDSMDYRLDQIKDHFDMGHWIPYRGNITESNDFDWTEDIGVDLLHVGSFVYLDGSSTENGVSGNWSGGQYIVLEIISIDEDGDVRYIQRHTNILEEKPDTGRVNHTEYENARRLVDKHYWQPWDGKQGLDITESNNF